MKTSAILCWIMLATTGASAGCMPAEGLVDGGPSADESGWLAVADYALDLSALPDGIGGSNDSIAFPIDLRQPVKKVTTLATDQIVEVYDRVGCWSGVERGLTGTVVGAGIPVGDAAWVKHIDVALIPDRFNPVEGLCFGYRGLDGTWHWNLNVAQPVYDAPTDRVRVRIPVTEGPMDALEIVFKDVYHLKVGAIAFKAARAVRAGDTHARRHPGQVE